MNAASRWFAVLAAAAALTGAAAALAAPDPEKELAALEQEYELAHTSPDTMKAFRPRYEAFAKANPGTEQALTAKLRLLEFTNALSRDDRTQAAAKLFDEIIAEYPVSPQLARIPEMWELFDRDKCGQMLRALSAPDKPDVVKAALLLNDANGLMLDNQVAKAEEVLDKIIEKYRDLPYRWSTFGVVADAMLNPNSPETLSLDMPAPELQGKDLDGKTIKLSEMKGRVVVIDFFGDWSDDCRAQYAHERALAEELKKQRFTLLGVNSDSSPARLAAAIAREKITWPVIFDNGSRAGPVARKWRITKPITYVIDAKGVIRSKNLRGEALTKTVKQLLAEAKRSK